jgi:beta-N-acetylhexosaminidase
MDVSNSAAMYNGSILPRARSTKALASSEQPNLLEGVDLSEWTLKEKIGQLLMVGYRDPMQITDWKVGGVVLFAWNLAPTIEGTKKTIDNIKSLASKKLKVPLFISTDQEGGRVLRIRRGMTSFPDAAAVGKIQDPLKSFKVGKYMGIELSSLGINMNFAPVLDLGGDESFLENRTWGKNTSQVGNFPIHFMRGLRSAGILPVVKHFPGHGSTGVDAHFKRPVVEKSMESLWKEDLKPFKTAIDEGALALMTAHVQYPQIDSLPASFSPKFLKNILRKQLGFQGLVITDDLEMDGAKSEGTTYGELAIQSLEAGSDIILLVWSKSRQKEIVRSIERAVMSGRLSVEWLDRKVERILSVKRKSFGTLAHSQKSNPYWKSNLRSRASLKLSREVSNNAFEWWAGSGNSIRTHLSHQWDSAWSVYVPKSAWRKIWMAKRPQDTVMVFNPRKAKVNFIKEMKMRLQFDDEPVILLTPPQNHWSAEVALHLKQTWIASQAAAREMPFFWIHQGRSLEKTWARPQGKGLSNGLSLFSETFHSFRQVQAMLTNASRDL